MAIAIVFPPLPPDEDPGAPWWVRYREELAFMGAVLVLCLLVAWVQTR